jgi:hypothetical protein
MRHILCVVRHVKRPKRIIESFFQYNIAVHTLIKVCMHVVIVNDHSYFLIKIKSP